MNIVSLFPKTSNQGAGALGASGEPMESAPFGLLEVSFHGVEIDRVALRKGTTSVGRGAKNDIRLNSVYVSFTHAAVSASEECITLVDLHSTNKTSLNGVAVQRSVLGDGDVIGIGDFELRYRAAPVDLPQRRPPPTEVASIENLGGTEQPSSEHGSTVQYDAVPDLDESVVQTALAESARQNRNPIEILCETMGYEESRVVSSLARIFAYSVIPSRELMQLKLDFEHFPAADARQRGCLIAEGPDGLIACIWDPFDSDIRAWVEARISDTLSWHLVSRGDLNACLSRYEQSVRAIDSALESANGKDGIEISLDDLSMASINKDSSPVVRLVRSTLFDALRANASDIHMETGSGRLDIRYRIDGVLVHIAGVSGSEIAEQVISRIKVMSELDISERRIPQDGRFKCGYDGRPIDFRVSIMPSTFGEDAVLRVLDKQAITDQMSELRIGGLGFDEDIVESLNYLARLPHGMMLVTGPTGSGKTTTLYAAITETNTGMGKIVTIEDPVEYQLPGVLQIPVNERKGLTFARGLRSILRHDPDKIMVGEIRDPETAQIAVQSALTGHLVFTTVHANNVFDVLSRFEHMGVDVYSFVAALNGILAQRLVRVICPNCKEELEPTADQLDATGLPKTELCSFEWRIGRGCSECRGTGFRGRKAVGELLVMNDELREAIISRAPVRHLKDLANKNNLRFIRSSAVDLVRFGLTTIEEVNRVIAV